MSFFSSLFPVNSPNLKTFNLTPKKIQDVTSWTFAPLDTHGAFIKQVTISNKSSEDLMYRTARYETFTALEGNTDITLIGWSDLLGLTAENEINAVLHLELVKEEVAREQV